MKSYLYLISLFCILFSVSAYADEHVPVEGEWSEERIRSLVPARPVIYMNDNVLSLYLADPLTDLEVVITDDSGNILYQGTVSANQPAYTYTITLAEDIEGGSITLSHQRYGYLKGWF